MKALLLGIALMICGCSPKASEGNIDVYDAEHNGHDYIIFENEKSGSISVLHSEDCIKCDSINKIK